MKTILRHTGFLTLLLLAITYQSNGQSLTSNQHDLLIEFPDIPGYRTLKCDFHMHTEFSDGAVWPGFRVYEALRHGLDAISITDHLEYQPHEKDIPHPDRNRTYELGLYYGKGNDIIIINGAEITREVVPPGHVNAIFVKDANKLIQDDANEVFKEAKRQGAFVFWNHPSWLAEQEHGIGSLSEMHRRLLEEGPTGGVEIANYNTYYEEAFQLAIDHDLAFIGNSDAHGAIEWGYDVTEDGHRTVTLVFAEEKSEEAIKEALENQRTVVWFKNTLFGRPEYLIPLIQSSLKATKPENSRELTVHIENNSDANYILENLSDYSFHNYPGIVIAKAHEVLKLRIKTSEEPSVIDLRFKVLNVFTAPGEHPVINLRAE